MIEGIQIERGESGSRAVAESAWSGEMTEHLLENGIVEIELNHGKGWRGTDVSFPARLPQLMAFKIIDLTISSVEKPIARTSEKVKCYMSFVVERLIASG
jgi:hypothetical protein